MKQKDHRTETTRQCIFKASREVGWWRLQDILTRNNLLFCLSREFCSTEQKILNASICLFQPFGKIKIAGSHEDKPSLALRKLRRRLPFVFLSSFLETMLLSESLISIIFLKPNQFWFQKNDGKNMEWGQNEMLGKINKMIDKTKTIYILLNIFY